MIPSMHIIGLKNKTPGPQRRSADCTALHGTRLPFDRLAGPLNLAPRLAKGRASG
jgi:hypothetical protein